MKLIKKYFFISLVILFVSSFAFAKDFDGIFGIYRMELHEKSGTFTLSILDEEGEKYVPVFNSLDNSSGTLFYLKSGSKVYPLSKLGGVPVIQNMNENSATITYNIKNEAEINLIFSFCSSETGTFTENSDLVIVDVLVKNISKKTKIFSLRGVFDTLLGENTPFHFTTKNINSLNNEAVFNSMYSDKWIKSSNGKISLKFLLDGETITRPSSVVVANRDILKVDSWDPKVVPGRGFNSLFSLNNSAVGITWNSYKIAPEKLFGIRFYLSGASSSNEPADANSLFFTSGKALQSASFVYDSDKLVTEEVVEYVVLTTNNDETFETSNSDKKNNSTPKQIEEFVSVSEGAESINEEFIEEDFVEDDFVESDFDDYDSTYSNEDEYSLDVGNLPYVEITPEKLNLDYVSQLIKEIDELEKNPQLYDASRILYLHTELDAILERLEQ